MSSGLSPFSDTNLFDNGVVGVVEIGSDGEILRANNFFCTVLGRNAADLCGSRLAELAHKDDRAILADHILDIGKAKAASAAVEVRLLSAGGGYVPTALHARPSPLAPQDRVLIFARTQLHLRAVERELEAAAQHRLLLEMSIGSALGNAIEARDAYTAGHQDKVSLLTARIAQTVGASPREREGAVQAAAVHDVGKIGVPVEYLVKPTKLSELELDVIRTHPRQGYQILKELPTDLPIAEIVYQHHERMDGSGYPRGLKNGEIMLESSIVAAADIIDAVVRPRPYREAMAVDRVVEILKSNRGSGLPADVVDASVEVLRSGV